jgi:FkbM family methyltransferase
MTHFFLQRLVFALPKKLQTCLSIFYFNWQNKFHRLVSSEAEFFLLKNWISEGDVVIDVGANIGRYSFEFSRIVGPTGHVYTFEPLPRIFFILSALSFLGNYKNITLINAAAGCNFESIQIPENWGALQPQSKHIFHTNTSSKITSIKNDDTKTNSRRSFSIDEFNISEKIALIKIDVEGFEYEVIKGALNIITRDRPIIIAELNDEKVTNLLASVGYSDADSIPNSRNKIYMPIKKISH